MADRRDNLLKIIVEEYIKSANPVGSSFVTEKYFKDLSSATIRNEMADLENEGLICQPHTSAGRIPTIDGYKYYLDNFADSSEISAKNKEELDRLAKNMDQKRDGIKDLAKTIASASDAATLVGFSPNDIYYTGISNIFRQPEFSHHTLIYSMSEVIDHLDEVIAKIFDQIGSNIEVLIGRDNPFGEMSSVVITKCKTGDQNGLLGILGPNRMNYQENISLLKYAQEILNK